MSEADKIIESLKKSGKKVEEFYMSNKTSDNVANIEDDVKILNNFCEYEDAVVLTDYALTLVQEAIEHILAELEQKDKRIKELEEKNKHLSNVSDYETISLECVHLEEQLEIVNSRVQELEEENKKLKAQCIFTRNNNATDQEKAELYDMIDKTIDTFLEQEKQIWQQEMTTDKMNLEEALNIVDAMYQDRYKIIEENNTVYVDRLKDVKFTNLEFASVILLREVQSLQSKLKNSIPKQVVIDKIEELRNQINIDICIENNIEKHYELKYKIEVLQELLETK